MREKIRLMTVNKHKPQIQFGLWHSNEKGYCPVLNREVIGICKAREYLHFVLKDKKKVELVLDKVREEEKVFVFGKDIDPFFEKNPGKYPNAFFLGVNLE
jgi:hypothetical protein